LNPVDQGKATPRRTEKPINVRDIELDDEGEVQIEQDIVVATTDAHFGEKVFTDISDNVAKTAEDSTDIAKSVADIFKTNTLDSTKELAKEKGLTNKQAEKIIDKNAKVIAREVETMQKKTKIEHMEAQIEYDRQVADANNDDEAIRVAEAAFAKSQKEIAADFKQRVVKTVEEKSKELSQSSTETILKKAEDKRKNTVEDDVRARLRGFARTIPSFLMAYGQINTNLANFDTTIKDEVFKEVTGITLEQFRTLRDTYQFFDEVVFNESIQEFLDKRVQLANYFDEDQAEDIFDYIPPQKTNQIFTPKKVVKLMIDKLAEENPGIFSDPSKTFADLYMKSGLYITEIVKRLFAGLKEQIPDDEARLKHILENQVYGFAPTEIIYHI